MTFGKKILCGGLITSRRDNYSIIHTRLVKNNKKIGCLEKKTEIYGLLQFVLLVELNVQEAQHKTTIFASHLWWDIPSNYADRLEKFPFTSAGRVENARTLQTNINI